MLGPYWTARLARPMSAAAEWRRACLPKGQALSHSKESTSMSPSEQPRIEERDSHAPMESGSARSCGCGRWLVSHVSGSLPGNTLKGA